MSKFKGGIFQYRVNGSVEDVIQKIIEWNKEKYKQDKHHDSNEYKKR